MTAATFPTITDDWRFVFAWYIRGTPAPGGSKKAITLPGRKFATLVDDGKHNIKWKREVAKSAGIYWKRPPLPGPVKLEVIFWINRPKYHWRTKGGKPCAELKESAPKYPTVKPDATKFLRSTEDALTGIVWVDDATIIDQDVKKRYCKFNDAPGAWVRVSVLREVSP